MIELRAPLRYCLNIIPTLCLRSELLILERSLFDQALLFVDLDKQTYADKTMQNVINSVKGTALGVAEYLTPVLKVGSNDDIHLVS